MADFSSMSDDDLLAQLPSAAAPAAGQTDFGRMSDDALLASLPQRDTSSTAANLGAGVLRGAKDVVDTGARWLATGFDKIAGTHEGERVQALNEAGLAEFEREHGDSTAAKLGRVAGQVAATLPVGGALGAGVKGLGAAAGVLPEASAALGEAIASGGLRAGGAGIGTRVAGGAISGGATAGLVNPDEAATGALIGAAGPAVVRGMGAAGVWAQRAAHGPEVPQAVRDVAAAGRDAGYVVPPTQVSPSAWNRLVEGIAGKISTAQNASARNQAVTNELARKAIGAEDLSPAGLAAVRQRANAAYDALGQAGTLTTDLPFSAAMTNLQRGHRQLAKDFPEVVNRDVDALLEAFAGKQSFDAQSGIEAIKRLRANAAENVRAAGDPERKALGKVQHHIAGALEDLVERNLQRQGRGELLKNFRDARTTLARAYDIEKALNPVTGNVDAATLARGLKKGRPLTQELRTIGEFASTFPKAVQTPERMGSLPQTSPLDWAAAGVTAAATGAGPLSGAALAMRPAARAVALSGFLQRRALEQQRATAGAGQHLLTDPVARVAPVVLTGPDR